MKKTLALLAICASSLVHAQGESLGEPAIKNSKIHIGVIFSGDNCFRTLTAAEANATNTSIIENRDRIETSKLGFTTGLALNYPLRKNLAFETGLLVSNKGYQLSETIATGNPIDPQTGFVGTDSGLEFKQHISQYYLDVPLYVQYRMGEGKLRFVAQAGVIGHVFLLNRTVSKTPYPDGTTNTKIQNIEEFENFNVSPALQLGVEWKTGDHHYLRFAPNFQFNLLSATDKPIEERYHSYGLALAYFVRF